MSSSSTLQVKSLTEPQVRSKTTLLSFPRIEIEQKSVGKQIVEEMASVRDKQHVGLSCKQNLLWSFKIFRGYVCPP